MRRPSLLATLLAVLIASLALPACGSADPTETSDAGASAKGGVGLKSIGRFEQPVYVTGAPGFPDLLFVVEQGGKVQVLKNGRRLGTPFLNISGPVQFEGERGLLSIAFPPNYTQSKRFYVYYTDAAGSIRVDEFKRASPTRALAGSRRSVIAIPHGENSNHNGGQMQFLGNLLYFGTGDGGSGGDPPNNAQNKEALLGKLLRIDPRQRGGRPYSVPASNPFVGRAGRDEIYSYGLRNPFRFSFDTVTAAQPRIAIGDVGQNRFEEIDYATVVRANGANFGWDAFEGFAPYDDENSGTGDPGGTVKPILAYPHSRGGSCSITGGYVVADRSLRSLYKRYVYADFCEGQLRTLVPHLKRASNDKKLGLSVQSPSSFGEDTRHRLYVTSLEGPVYRLVPR
ncbi:MAG TPA: PQQ-dependent sugar dehydrogenase [Solirubrobacterales bacterium]|jgi:glucose/arabinose dehydrogenase|nr:PQQ-dependent sugar dehydrogenase [Solirubrobacterales bacterium]